MLPIHRHTLIVHSHNNPYTANGSSKQKPHPPLLEKQTQKQYLWEKQVNKTKNALPLLEKTDKKHTKLKTGRERSCFFRLHESHTVVSPEGTWRRALPGACHSEAVIYSGFRKKCNIGKKHNIKKKYHIPELSI